MFRFTEITSDDEMNETVAIKEDKVDLDINEGNAKDGKYITSKLNCLDLIRNSDFFNIRSWSLRLFFLHLKLNRDKRMYL